MFVSVLRFNSDVERKLERLVLCLFLQGEQHPVQQLQASALLTGLATKTDTEHLSYQIPHYL